ncbi:MAG: tryptophan synthase subunit alpha [bacterium]|nr:tryptophan synthase subunit alpha [bacterium]
MPISTSVFKSKNTVIPYFTFGYPSVAFTEDLIRAAAKAGADAIEIGIPFSDPIADGPVIQASHTAALRTGEDVSVFAALKMVSRLKKEVSIPLIFMCDANLIAHYGVSAFFKDAGEHGLEGIVMPNLPVELAGSYMKHAKSNGVDIIFLIAPMTDKERIQKIVAASSGFIYLISSKGLTGERASFNEDLKPVVDYIKSIKDIPVAIGFGISNKEHVEFVNRIADGAIIGSYFIRQITESLPDDALAKKRVMSILEQMKD